MMVRIRRMLEDNEMEIGEENWRYRRVVESYTRYQRLCELGDRRNKRLAFTPRGGLH